MSMIATIYLISNKSYEATLAGDIDNLDSEEFGNSVDLDKSWHAVHHIIGGSNKYSFLDGGYQLDSVSEHAEVHSPEKIIELKKYFSEKSADNIVPSIDWSELHKQNIYGGKWDDSRRKYISEYLTVFIALVERASNNGCGLFVIIA